MSDDWLDPEGPAGTPSGSRLRALLLATIAGGPGDPTAAGLPIDAVVARQRLMQEQIERFLGRTVTTIVGTTLVQFSQPIEALRCALSVQRAVVRAVGALGQMRIGLHYATVDVLGAEVSGAALTVLADLTPQAEPGGLCASGDFIGALEHGEIPFASLGPVTLSSSGRAVELFVWPPRDSVRTEALAVPPFPGPSGATEVPALPEPAPFDPPAPQSVLTPALSGEVVSPEDEVTPPPASVLKWVVLGAVGALGLGGVVLWQPVGTPPHAPKPNPPAVTVTLAPALAVLASAPPVADAGESPGLLDAGARAAVDAGAPAAAVAVPSPVARPPPPPDEIADLVAPARERLVQKKMKPALRAKLGSKLDNLELKAKNAATPKGKKKAMAALHSFIAKHHL